MKKNDFATIIAYVLMLGVAILMGLLVIKPVLDEFGNAINGSIHYIVLVILSLMAGVVLNALLLEFGHLLGARVGKYEVLSCVILGFGMKKTKEKKKFGFHTFEGLVGETTVRPLDPKNSSLGAYVFFPVLGLIIEVTVLMIIRNVASKQGGDLAWLQVLSLTMLSVGIMVFIYDLFPAHIDSENDGFLLTLIGNPANRYAYNNILLQRYATNFGVEAPEPVVYDEITEFTAALNIISVTRLLVDGKSKEAEAILEHHLNPEARIPSAVKAEAMAYKLAILLERKDKAAGKKYYDELSDAQRRYIADMMTMPALRCYVLIAAYIENNEDECNYAIDKVSRVLKTCLPEVLEAEKTLIDSEVKEIREQHISWEVYPLPWEEQDFYPEEENSEEEESSEEEEEETKE